MLTGQFTFPAIERIVYGKPAADALKAEAQRLDATRVFLMVSGTMNRETDEVEKPREDVIVAANAARAVGADLLVTFGGGSLTDAGKVVQLCLRHDIADIDGLEPFRAITGADGKLNIPKFDAPVVRQIAI